jgi:uncharacterized membrane protein YcaP (DUF421 family)
MQYLEELFLKEGSSLEVHMMALRAIVVFLVTLLYIRIAKKRFLGRNTAFDIVLSIIMGSLLARTINGSAPLLSTLAAALTLIGLHHGFTFIIAKSPRLGSFFEGTPKTLMKNGRLDEKALLEHHLTKSDIMEAIRTGTNSDSIDNIKQCYLENNGKLSVIVKDK